MHLNRVHLIRHLAPLHLDQPRGILPVQAQDVGTVLAMDGDPPAPGDIAHDGIVRHRLAAARDLGQQITDTLDPDVGWMGARRAGRP